MKSKDSVVEHGDGGSERTFDYLFGSLNGMVKVQHDYDYYGNFFRETLFTNSWVVWPKWWWWL